LLKSLQVKREQLKNEGKIDENNKLTDDILFSSPSAASDFIIGYSTSGPMTWKNHQGKTLKEIESGKK